MATERDQKLWATVLAIPKGKVASYGQIADLAGLGRGARLVSPAMGRAPKALKLPWHRVVSVSGKLSIPSTSRWHQLQIDRLSEEGVAVVNSKVDMKTYGWQPSMDELLWGAMTIPIDA